MDWSCKFCDAKPTYQQKCVLCVLCVLCWSYFMCFMCLKLKLRCQPTYQICSHSFRETIDVFQGRPRRRVLHHHGRLGKCYPVPRWGGADERGGRGFFSSRFQLFRSANLAPRTTLVRSPCWTRGPELPRSLPRDLSSVSSLTVPGGWHEENNLKKSSFEEEEK